MATAASVPEHIGPYDVLRAIAQGGTAEVYEVRDPDNGQHLALKRLMEPAHLLHRFEREYEAMTRLNHPGITRVYLYGIHQGKPWITMELLRGTPAHHWTKAFGTPGSSQRTHESLRVGYRISDALSYLHERGLVHRDLKSANVLVLPDGRVKIVDFGAAHIADPMFRITQPGEFIGTFQYASPEQLKGSHLDGRSDLYSMGVLLYRLVTGRRPFRNGTTEQVVEQHLYADPLPPSTLVPEIAPQLEELILAMLAKDPKQRPQTAREVAGILEQLAGRPFEHRSPLALHIDRVTTRSSVRQKALQLLDRDERSPVVAVTGDAGSDRNRVVETIAEDVKSRGWYVLEIDGSGGLPGLLEAIGDFASTHGDMICRAAGANLQKASRIPIERLIDPKLRVGLRQAGATVLHRVTEDQTPVLIVIRSAEAGDSLFTESVVAFRRAAVEMGTRPRMLLSLPTGALDKNTLWGRRMFDATVLPLPPLQPDQISNGVGDMLGRRPPPALFAERLRQNTGGQPLWIEATIRELIDSHQLGVEGNQLEWRRQALDVRPPQAAQEQAAAFLAELPAAGWAVVLGMSVVPEPLDIDLLARSIQHSVPEVQALLELPSLRQLVEVDFNGTLKWRIPLARGLVKRRLRSARRALLIERLAEKLTHAAPSRNSVHVLTRAQNHKVARQHAVRLVRTHLEAFEPHRALDILQIVLPHANIEPDARVAELFLLGSRALQTSRPTDPEGAQALQRATKLIAEDDTRLTALALLTKAGQLLAVGHYASYRTHLDNAIDAIVRARIPEYEVELCLRLAESELWRGELEQATSWLTQASRAANDEALQFRVALMQARRMLIGGEAAAALDLSGSCLQHHERNGDEPRKWEAAAVFTDVLRRMGRWSEAIRLLHQLLPAAKMAQDPRLYASLLLVAAWCEVDLLRLGRAQDLLEELGAVLTRSDPLEIRLERAIVHGRVLLASGQHLSAAYHLQETVDRARSAGLVLQGARARSLLAEALWLLRSRDRARSAFKSAELGLMASKAQLYLADTSAAQARTAGRGRDPELYYGKVSTVLEEEPLKPLQLERKLAECVLLRAKGQRQQATMAYRQAAMLLNRIAHDLNDTDRAALRVHTWSRRIRKGLR